MIRMWYRNLVILAFKKEKPQISNNKVQVTWFKENKSLKNCGSWLEFGSNIAQPFGLNWLCYLAGKCQMALMIFSHFSSWDKTIQILVKAIGTVPVLVTYYFGFSWCVQWQSFSFTFWDEHENSFIQDVGWLIKNGWKSNRFL